MSKAHTRVRRHFKSAKFDETQPAGGTIRRIKLVDADFRPVGVAGDVHQQVSQEPVHQPREGCRPLVWAMDLGEGDFQLIETVVSCLVNAWCLGRRADEQTREQVGQAWMALPMQDQAAQEVRTAQERAVERCRSADNYMIAATCAGVFAIDHELVGTQAGLTRVFNKRLR